VVDLGLVDVADDLPIGTAHPGFGDEIGRVAGLLAGGLEQFVGVLVGAVVPRFAAVLWAVVGVDAKRRVAISWFARVDDVQEVDVGVGMGFKGD